MENIIGGRVERIPTAAGRLVCHAGGRRFGDASRILHCTFFVQSDLGATCSRPMHQSSRTAATWARHLCDAIMGSMNMYLSMILSVVGQSAILHSQRILQGPCDCYVTYLTRNWCSDGGRRLTTGWGLSLSNPGAWVLVAFNDS